MPPDDTTDTATGTDIDQQRICDAITTTIDEFQHTGDAPVTPRSITHGNCEAFAECVNKRLNGALTTLTTTDVVGGDPPASPSHGTSR